MNRDLIVSMGSTYYSSLCICNFTGLSRLHFIIRKIEALILGASTEGERNAAISAKERMVRKYPRVEGHENTQEFALYTSDMWHKKLLLAICRKYGVKPYRYHRQKYTTVMLTINKKFLNDVIWKEYVEFSEQLEALVEDITDDLISKIHTFEQEEVRN